MLTMPTASLTSTTELCCLDDSSPELSGQLACTSSSEPHAYSQIPALASVTTSTVSLAASVAGDVSAAGLAVELLAEVDGFSAAVLMRFQGAVLRSIGCARGGLSSSSDHDRPEDMHETASVFACQWKYQVTAGSMCSEDMTERALQRCTAGTHSEEPSFEHKSAAMV